MRQSSVIVVASSVALSISAFLTLQSPVSAQGVPPSGQSPKPPTSTPPQPIQGAVGQIKTDTGKTSDDVKALDVGKTQQDAGQVKKDVQGLEDSAKDMMSNPLGK